jgi:hypothetical protein
VTVLTVSSGLAPPMSASFIAALVMAIVFAGENPVDAGW